METGSPEEPRHWVVRDWSSLERSGYQTGVVRVLELVSDLQPVVPLLPPGQTEGQAEVGPGEGHGRVGEGGVGADLDDAALTYRVVQLGVQLHLSPGETGVVREGSAPAVAAPALGWTQLAVRDVSPEVGHQLPLLHPGHGGLVSPGED